MLLLFVAVRRVIRYRQMNITFTLVQEVSLMAELLHLAEVARRLGVGRTTVWALRKSGELPTVHVGSHPFVSDKAVDDYIDRHAEEV
jgi:excisionase family DNA binding protein